VPVLSKINQVERQTSRVFNGKDSVKGHLLKLHEHFGFLRGMVEGSHSIIHRPKSNHPGDEQMNMRLIPIPRPMVWYGVISNQIYYPG